MVDVWDDLQLKLGGLEQAQHDELESYFNTLIEGDCDNGED